MKKVFLVFILIVLSIVLINCSNETEENKEDITTLSVNEKEEIKETFYNANLNIQNLEGSELTFSGFTMRDSEIHFAYKELIQNKILSYTPKGKISALAIYHINSKTHKIQDKDIIGISVYEIDKKDRMDHHFFLKNESGIFDLKVSLLESFVNTENQNFLIWKYKNKSFKNDHIGINRILNSDDERENRLTSQRNEFEVFRVMHQYQSLNTQKSAITKGHYTNRGFADCVSGCSEAGNGTCDAGLYCNVGGDCPICEDCDNQDKVIELGLVNDILAEQLFDLTLHRSLRDDFMKNYYVGQKYIDYYNAISAFILASDYDTNTFLKMINTLPSFNTSIRILLDENTANDGTVLITSELKKDINSIIDDFMTMSNNPDFQFILNDLKSDIEFYSEKSKKTILSLIN